MVRYRPNAVVGSTMRLLLSEHARAEAVGLLEWSLKQPGIHQGIIEVRTVIEDCPVGRLRLQVSEQAPSEPAVQYLMNGVPVRRLDVNGTHRDWAFTTHKHRYRPTGHEDAYIPDDIPAVPIGPTVAPGTHRAVFEAFAEECFISLPDGYWTDAEGRVTP